MSNMTASQDEPRLLRLSACTTQNNANVSAIKEGARYDFKSQISDVADLSLWSTANLHPQPFEQGGRRMTIRD